MPPAKPKRPGLPESPIRPFHLAWASYLYESMTDYAAPLDRFRSETGTALDLGRPDHRLALLKFLNEWGCRPLAKDWHWLASEELDRWYRGAQDQLRLLDGPLAELDVTRLSDLAELFNSLSSFIAAKKVRNGQEVLVSFGPTAASKALFALRPRTLPAWDGPMRQEFGYDGAGESYVAFVKDVHRKLVETTLSCEQRGFNLEDLPAKLRRPAYTTACQLIIEYYWLTTTRRLSLPAKRAMREWLGW